MQNTPFLVSYTKEAIHNNAYGWSNNEHPIINFHKSGKCYFFKIQRYKPNKKFHRDWLTSVDFILLKSQKAEHTNLTNDSILEVSTIYSINCDELHKNSYQSRKYAILRKHEIESFYNVLNSYFDTDVIDIVLIEITKSKNNDEYVSTIKYSSKSQYMKYHQRNSYDQKSKITINKKRMEARHKSISDNFVDGVYSNKRAHYENELRMIYKSLC